MCGIVFCHFYSLILFAAFCLSLAGGPQSKDASHESPRLWGKTVRTDEKSRKIMKMKENDVKMMRLIDKCYKMMGIRKLINK